MSALDQIISYLEEEVAVMNMASDDQESLYAKPNPHFQSAIRFHGVPILPPVVSLIFLQKIMLVWLEFRNMQTFIHKHGMLITADKGML